MPLCFFFCLGVKHLTHRHQEKNKNRSLHLQSDVGDTFLRCSQFFKRLLQQARGFYLFIIFKLQSSEL